MNLAMLLDIPAMVVPDDLVLRSDRDETYFELRSNAARVSGLLREWGIGPGDRVGIFATNRSGYIEVMFGTAAVGAVIVPLNCRARGAELTHLLTDSGIRVLFTEPRYVDMIRQAVPDDLFRLSVFEGDYESHRDAATPSDEIEDVADEDLALLLYTSGTTSLPKGVMLTHGALSGYVFNQTECADGTEQGRMLLSAPLHHIAGITSLLLSIYSGRAVVVLPQFEAGAWLDAVENQKVTHAFVVPTMLARLIAHPDITERDLSSLELVTYGAAPMPPSVIRRALEIFPSTTSFSGAYGQTETTSTVTVLGADDHRLEGTPEEKALKLRRLSSVGKPVDDVEIRIVDELGKPLPAGELGEVLLRTSRTMTGYWGNSSSSTRGAIDEEGWIHTGDLGLLDEGGYLFLGGRASDMIIRGGENVSPEEVETVLYEHPGVAEAGVVGVPDEEWGERIMAVVVPQPGIELTEEEVINFCGPHLPSFKRPERVLVRAWLPKTSTGKLLRRELVPLFHPAD